MGRFIGVDPLADKYPGWNPYNYILNNPVRLVDPSGMSAEESDWISSVNDRGDIILTAEKGDNYESLMKFFKEKENAFEFLESWALNENIEYSEGDEVKLNSTNVFSKMMKYYFNNKEKFAENDSWDCRESVRQLVLNETPLEDALKPGTTPSALSSFGKDWSRKEKISSGEKQFGKTFSNWDPIPFGGHAATYFGTDRSGNEYFFTKNGVREPLKIESLPQLKKTYTLWNIFITDYKRGK